MIYSGDQQALAFCSETQRLRDDFVTAAHHLNRLLTEQVQAVIAGDEDFARFDVLIHMAQERKEHAKYAWIGHVESHHCEEA